MKMKDLKYIQFEDYETHRGITFSKQLSYQTFGKPIGEAPIVLVIHALTGNSQICGEHGWWNDLIGNNKCIDLENYTVLAFNIPGNGFDNNPKNLFANYKDFVARDIAEVFFQGLNLLGIHKLFAIIGGSVGGGIAWEMAALYPKLAEHLIPIATDWKATDWLIANCYIQDSILNHSSKPLFDARLHAMTLYRTPESLTNKFQRTKKEIDTYNVESWLTHHGDVLEDRFKLAAYKMMNQILRTIDITNGKNDFLEVASKIESNIHIVTINSDLFFKPEENWSTYVELKSVKDNVSISELRSIHGHDAFLIEFQQLSGFLKPIFKKVNAAQSTFRTAM